MDKSPYLSAVQALSGQYPGEKYKDLHQIATEIMEDGKEREEFLKTGETSRVKPALVPYLRIVFGTKFGIGEFVVEALKSDDVTIVRQALSARWFYSSSGPLIDVKYFVENVVPEVSMRTRLELMKTLAHCLVEDPRKAEHFFDNFADSYGVEQTLPLIVACGEEYIFEAVLRRRIVLPKRILTALYRRYPLLVIRYLRLGNAHCPENEAERKLHRIDLGAYTSFLPQLVKHHTNVFIELYECLTSYDQSAKLGSTRAEFFLKNATDTLIQRPGTFLDLLPLKLVSNKLSTQQFDTMFENLLPRDERDFSISNVIKYLLYYPREKKLNLMLKAYKRRYDGDLLDDAEAIFSAKEFYKLLPTEIKELRARNYVKNFEGRPEYQEYLRFLPPGEAVPLLMNTITKMTDLESRSRYIEHMIISCSLYNSKADLLEVLDYYNTRHKNEQAVVLQQVLGALVQRFDISKLDQSHWKILKEIIHRSYIKGDLNDAPTITYVPLFAGALRYYIKRCQDKKDEEDAKFLDRLVRIITELFFERNMKWDFISELPDVGREWLCKFLEVIPQLYNEAHPIWNKSDNKMVLATYLIRAMQGLNAKGELRKRKHKKGSATTSDSDGRPRPARFSIADYPWLKKLVYGLLKTRNKRSTRDFLRQNPRRFAKMLRLHDADLYQSLIDEDEELTNDVQSEDALLLLKRDHEKILAKWKQYLDVCREAVQFSRRSTQRFIISTKWHRDLPIRFAEKCAAELEVKGNALILGLLVEGDALKELITPYLPKESRIDVNDGDAKRMYEIIKTLPKAMNLANPPLPFDVLSKFCQGDFISLALQALTNAGQRIPVHKVLAFVKEDLGKKPITVKKEAIRLVFQIATRTESCDFLRHLWNQEVNHSVRDVLAKMILKLFKKSPNQDSWTLLKVCIEGLTAKDRDVFSSLERVNQIDTSYVALYLQEFIKKLDSFKEAELSRELRLQHFESLVNSIDSEVLRHLPEELVIDILKRYPLCYSTSFTIGVYLLSDKPKFEVRLKAFIDILLKELEQFDVPDKEVSRCCVKNHEVRNFFIEVVSYLYQENNEKSTRRHLRLVREILSLFESALRPWKEMLGYISLLLCKDYLQTGTPSLFGEKVVVTAKRLVEVCASELVLAQFTDVLLTKVLQNDHVFRGENKLAAKLTIIEAMMKVDPRIGALVGIKLLLHFEESRYDQRFDEFMNTWTDMDDPMVQALLKEFVNTANKLYHGVGITSTMRFLSLH